MKTTRPLFLILLTAFGLGVGCSTPPKPVTDPLAGWKVADYGYQPKEIKETIGKDYQDYIQRLPTEEHKLVGNVELFEDGTGRHAMRILVNLNGTRWAHVLIYDTENKRIQVIKYVFGHYRS